MTQQLQHICILWLAQLICGVSPCASMAQGADGDLAAAKQEYETAIAELRNLTVTANKALVDYFDGSRDDSDTHREAWLLAVQAGERQRLIVEQTAMRYLQLSDAPPKELMDLLIEIHNSAVNRGRWHKAEEVAAVLRPTFQNNEGFLFRDAIAAISSNQFDRAEEFLQKYGNLIPNMPERQRSLFQSLGDLRSNFDREKRLIEESDQGEPLPRVALKTTKGKIEVELFEDQAPDTVGNFINLVEQGFYTDITFHRVIDDFVAQTGGIGLDNLNREPAYSIFDEYNAADARKHFQGYLSMANAGIPDSGSSQFFITFCPLPNLDGRHTVFGRVINGYDVFESINRTHEIDDDGVTENEIRDVVPDYIISATVIQKRNHEYKPRKVQ